MNHISEQEELGEKDEDELAEKHLYFDF